MEICCYAHLFLPHKVCFFVALITQYKTHQTLVKYKETKGRQVLLRWRERGQAGHCQQPGPNAPLLVHSTFSFGAYSNFRRKTSFPGRWASVSVFYVQVRCFFLQWLPITVSAAQTLGEVKWVSFLRLPISF